MTRTGRTQRAWTDEKAVQAHLGYRRHSARRNCVIVGGHHLANVERPLTYQGVGPLNQPSVRDVAIPG